MFLFTATICGKLEDFVKEHLETMQLGMSLFDRRLKGFNAWVQILNAAQNSVEDLQALIRRLRQCNKDAKALIDAQQRVDNLPDGEKKTSLNKSIWEIFKKSLIAYVDMNSWGFLGGDWDFAQRRQNYWHNVVRLENTLNQP